MVRKQTTVITLLIGVLLAVLASSVVILWLVPDAVVGPETTVESRDEAAALPVVPPPQNVPEHGFNVSVLETAAYLLLDKQPVTEGALPVRPPATTGKANPFL